MWRIERYVQTLYGPPSLRIDIFYWLGNWQSLEWNSFTMPSCVSDFANFFPQFKRLVVISWLVLNRSFFHFTISITSFTHLLNTFHCLCLVSHLQSVSACCAKLQSSSETSVVSNSMTQVWLHCRPPFGLTFIPAAERCVRIPDDIAVPMKTKKNTHILPPAFAFVTSSAAATVSGSSHREDARKRKTIVNTLASMYTIVHVVSWVRLDEVKGGGWLVRSSIWTYIQCVRCVSISHHMRNVFGAAIIRLAESS